MQKFGCHHGNSKRHAENCNRKPTEDVKNVAGGIDETVVEIGGNIGKNNGQNYPKTPKGQHGFFLLASIGHAEFIAETLDAHLGPVDQFVLVSLATRGATPVAFFFGLLAALDAPLAVHFLV